MDHKADGTKLAVCWGGLVQTLREDCADHHDIDATTAKLLERVDRVGSSTTFAELKRNLEFSVQECDYLNSPLLDELHRSVIGLPGQQFTRVSATSPFPLSAEAVAWTSVCEHGRLKALKYLLDRFPIDFKPLMSQGLMVAAVSGQPEVFDMLLPLGAQIDICNFTAIANASRRGHVGILTELLRARRSVAMNPPADSATSLPETIWSMALHGAVVANQPATVALLMKECPHHRTSSSAAWAFSCASSVDVVRAMINNGFPMDKTLGVATTAVCNGDAATLECLMEHGLASVGSISSLLQAAVSCKRVDTVRYLLKFIQDDAPGLSQALQSACGIGHAELVRLLLGASANVRGNSQALLPFAVVSGSCDVISLLLDAGIDIHASNDFALRHAVSVGRVDMVELLLRRGADVNAISDDALTAAREAGALHLIEPLLAQARKQPAVLPQCTISTQT